IGQLEILFRIPFCSNSLCVLSRAVKDICRRVETNFLHPIPAPPDMFLFFRSATIPPSTPGIMRKLLHMSLLKLLALGVGLVEFIPCATCGGRITTLHRIGVLLSYSAVKLLTLLLLPQCTHFLNLLLVSFLRHCRLRFSSSHLCLSSYK